MDSVSCRYVIESNLWESDIKIGLMGRFYTATGEIVDKNSNGKYKGLMLSVKKTDYLATCYFRGSLPKFLTDAKTNSYDFTRLDLIKTIEKLKTELFIIPEKTEVKSPEYCAFIESPFDFHYMRNSLLTHKQLNYKLEMTEDGKAFGFTFKRQHYDFKIYFKDMQESGIRNSRLKIEIKIKKMVFLKNRDINIQYLSDLTRESVWRQLSDLLLELWEEIIFVEKDNYEIEKMRPQEKIKLEKYLNSNFWSDKKLDDNNFYKAKANLEKLNEKYLIRESGKHIISNLIREKCEFLIKTGEELTSFENAINNRNRREINPLDKGLIPFPNPIKEEGEKRQNEKPRKCKNKGCETDITNRRKNTLFCSTKCRCKQHREEEKIAQKLFAFCP